MRIIHILRMCVYTFNRTLRMMRVHAVGNYLLRSVPSTNTVNSKAPTGLCHYGFVSLSGHNGRVVGTD